MVYRLSRLLTALEVRPDMLTIRRGEEERRGEPTAPAPTPPGHHGGAGLAAPRAR